MRQDQDRTKGEQRTESELRPLAGALLAFSTPDLKPGQPAVRDKQSGGAT